MDNYENGVKKLKALYLVNDNDTEPGRDNILLRRCIS